MIDLATLVQRITGKGPPASPQPGGKGIAIGGEFAALVRLAAQAPAGSPEGGTEGGLRLVVDNAIPIARGADGAMPVNVAPRPRAGGEALAIAPETQPAMTIPAAKVAAAQMPAGSPAPEQPLPAQGAAPMPTPTANLPSKPISVLEKPVAPVKTKEAVPDLAADADALPILRPADMQGEATTPRGTGEAADEATDEAGMIAVAPQDTKAGTQPDAQPNAAPAAPVLPAIAAAPAAKPAQADAVVRAALPRAMAHAADGPAMGRSPEQPVKAPEAAPAIASAAVPSQGLPPQGNDRPRGEGAPIPLLRAAATPDSAPTPRTPAGSVVDDIAVAARDGAVPAPSVPAPPAPAPSIAAASERASGPAPTAGDEPAPATTPLRAIVDMLPPVIQTELGQAAVRAPAGVGGPSTAQALGAQVIEMGVSGQWIDRMAREIASLASGEGHSRFTLSPPHLGRLQVDLIPGQTGMDVHLLAETDEAARRLSEGRSALHADARLSAINLGQITVEKANAPFEGSTRDQGQGQAQRDLAGQTQHQQPGDRQTQGRGGQDERNGGGTRAARDQSMESDDAAARATTRRAAAGHIRFA